ncbi:CheR family methyltransferase [Endothiovibrio diazotrophicus]
MSVTYNDNAGIRRIEVLGLLDQEEERSALAEAVHPSGWVRCEVSFYDARTLPAAAVDALAGVLWSGRALKIHAYHTYLAHFLLRLGLPAVTVPSHSMRDAQAATRAVVLGGSAESLDKIIHIVERLPLSDATVFIVQHVLEDEENHLDRLLRSRTDYTVVMPHHLMEIQPATIYIAPPGHHLKVAHGRVYLTRDRKVQYARPSLDVLFESVAHEYGEHAMAVLLCGFGQDGVKGMATLKAKGATVIVEESSDCVDAHVLPDHGRASGHYDHAFHRQEIAAFLAAALVGRERQPSSTLVDLLLEALYVRYGYDFRGYQRGTVERRLDKLARLRGNHDFFELVRELLAEPESFERLFLELSINVTAFFRHPHQFRLLRERVLPYLDSFPRVKIWSAGCSTGEEVYSLAVLLDELGMLEKSQIFATDINRYVLEEAKGGLFPREKLDEDRANYREGGGETNDVFLHDNGLYLEIEPRYRRHILFHHHSLAQDGVFNEFQLILCRNVMIYFHPRLQRRVTELFAKSLHRDGFLMLGPSDALPHDEGERYFTPYAEREKVYRWK